MIVPRLLLTRCIEYLSSMHCSLYSIHWASSCYNSFRLRPKYTQGADRHERDDS
ncbi:hypothetical protein BDV32DRAFT_118029, partial [Aspergillus pseudonomiae]